VGAVPAGRDGITVKELAGRFGVKRQQLYENEEFQGLREVGNKLFQLFDKAARRGDWRGPRGGKNKGGLEAWDTGEDDD
jgi:hypothetical protein